MRRLVFLTVGMIVLILLLILPAPPSQAQTKEEKQFMKQHEKEMTTFMEKCSGCHSLQRILAKKRSKEEWDRVLKVMAGKPHANISEEDLKKIQKWIDFMQSTIPPGP
jgi:ABC-type transport system involved in cytochrome bd biosynthesis fused ATPase/permease subunit